MMVVVVIPPSPPLSPSLLPPLLLLPRYRKVSIYALPNTSTMIFFLTGGNKDAK